MYPSITLVLPNDVDVVVGGVLCISKVPSGLLLFSWVATSIIDEKDKTFPIWGRLSR